MPYFLIICFTVWFIDFLRAPSWAADQLALKRIWYKTYYGEPVPRRLKPFDCVLCLSFWLAFFYSLTCKNFFDTFLYSAATSLGASVLSLILNKLR